MMAVNHLTEHGPVLEVVFKAICVVGGVFIVWVFTYPHWPTRRQLAARAKELEKELEETTG